MRVIAFPWLILALGLAQAAPAAPAAPAAANLQGTDADRRAIQALLDSYTKAVSTKDQALFETLLLNKHIPFSHVRSAVKRAAEEDGTQNYEQFRKGVFEGPPFTQRFEGVHITQDGVLADVTLKFFNTSAEGTSWGWKTMQLLEVDGHWKIASELFTTH